MSRIPYLSAFAVLSLVLLSACSAPNGQPLTGSEPVAPSQIADFGTLYAQNCAACHGADGTGSATGKKMGAHDFTTADVQGMSDAELTDTITNGKNKMPKYGTSLKPEDIKGLVAYIRTLKK